MCELDPVYIGLLRNRICFIFIYNILKKINDKNIVKSDRQKEEISKYLLKRMVNVVIPSSCGLVVVGG